MIWLLASITLVVDHFGAIADGIVHIASDAASCILHHDQAREQVVGVHGGVRQRIGHSNAIVIAATN
jgi:hypothetical protein